ncbi:hypothetical protein MKX01_040790 [Papaver californicum]|nr:hypothetical protein MKX01_040790 [Papaver californicum]
MESQKDLVIYTNFDCLATGVSLQSMGSRHVALVALLLRSEGFEQYHYNISMGLKLEIMTKILKNAGNDDIITIKGQDKMDNFEMKLMDINNEHLGIPDVEYSLIVQMPSAECARKLSTIGDTGP